MTIRHVCGQDPESCFCMYDPELNPELKARRLILAEVTDEMVERVARALAERAGDLPCFDAPRHNSDRNIADDWRDDARAALTAAFQETERPEEGS